MNDTYDELLKFIIEKKEQQNLTIARFSDMVCCDRKSMSNWLRYEQMMPARVLLKSLEVLGYPIIIEDHEKIVKDKRLIISR